MYLYTKRIIGYLTLILIFLSLHSCRNLSAQESLVYLRGKDSNGEELVPTATGFIIARKDSFFDKEYFVLTTKHSIEGIGKSKTFKAIPYLARKTYVPQPEESTISNAQTFQVDDTNEFNVKHIEDLDNLDVSIISFTSKLDLPVPYISMSKPIRKNNLLIYGFVKCNFENTQSKIYAYHKIKGHILVDKDILEKKDGTIRQDGKEILERIKLSEEKYEIEKQNIDLRYSNPTKAGMSGSPLVNTQNNEERIVGIQLANYSFEEGVDNVDNCLVAPERIGIDTRSYGTSMEKIMQASNFPQYIKELMKLEPLKE
jgi:hypothetical protein